VFRGSDRGTVMFLPGLLKLDVTECKVSKHRHICWRSWDMPTPQAEKLALWSLELF